MITVKPASRIRIKLGHLFGIIEEAIMDLSPVRNTIETEHGILVLVQHFVRANCMEQKRSVDITRGFVVRRTHKSIASLYKTYAERGRLIQFMFLGQIQGPIH